MRLLEPFGDSLDASDAIMEEAFFSSVDTSDLAAGQLANLVYAVRYVVMLVQSFNFRVARYHRSRIQVQ